MISKVPGFKGTTLLGDDQIAYVISNEDVISLAMKKYEFEKSEAS